jgi:hypothetical protein
VKYILIALLVIHGLVHLLGFVKAFGLAQPPQLQAAISRPVGLLWLVVALLLLVSGGMVLVAGKWWLPAALGVVMSQILIFAAWHDAKAGSIVNLILLLPIVVAALGSAPWSFRATYDREAAAGLSQGPPQSKLLTEADIAHLPPAVQRYMAFVGAVGKPRVWNYRLRFRGALRNGPDDTWMPVTADQQNFTDPPARLFLVESLKFGVPFTAFHRYVGPQATFKVKLASLLTVVDAYGTEMDQSETVTLLNDMFLLAPPTLIDPHIVWEELDPMTVRATWTNAGNTVSAVVSFDSSGALVNFVSDDRYKTVDGKKYERLRWSTPVSGWREVEGRKLFSTGEAAWGLAGSEFAYGRFELLDVQYNVTGR